MPPADFFRRFGLFVQRGFLGSDLLESLQREQDRAQWTPAVVGKEYSEEADVNEEIRRTLVAKLPKDDRHGAALRDLLRSVQPMLSEHFEVSLERFERPQLLHYRSGDFFTPHRDGADEESGYVFARSRKVSVSLFLNAPPDYEGGELVFYELFSDVRARAKPFPLQPEPGLLVAFPSTLLHGVAPVVSGERRTIVTWYH